MARFFFVVVRILLNFGLCYIYIFFIKTKRVQSDFQGTVLSLYGAETCTFIDFKVLF